LEISNRSCPTCPVTVKKSLEQLDGVKQVEVFDEDKEVMVTFDDEVIHFEALTKATAHAGFPSFLKKTTKQAITISVPTLSCWLCSITIKKSLKQVEGVKRVSVSYKDKEARVIFDTEITNVDALSKATTNAGYPSFVKKEEKKKE